MVKYTQKQLRGMLSWGLAMDISTIGCEDAKTLKKEEGGIFQVGYSGGVYGCNGMLLQGYKTGQLYIIVGRTQAIYLF